ncbi:MAG: type III pantothenate kinase [Gammaproteobacteria bacterium]|jgi:type III pantothenate kinase
MIAIDCGNTRLKWARFEGRARLDGGHASLRGAGDPFEALAAGLGDLAGRNDSAGHVLVANVAGPEVAEHISAAVRSTLGRDSEFVSVQANAHGIECAYADPGTLGVDRWLAMIAARNLRDGPFAVVGAGTALTFDAVDRSGRHLGGLILPGDRLMIEALASHAEQIPVVPPAGRAVRGLEILGRSTAEAVSHGARLALAAAVDRAVATVTAELGEAIAVLLTGGDAPLVEEWLASDAEVEADLVLEGLAVIGGEKE